ncbi:hypothetical protein PB1_16329 [Bacillus methanolicus PB1]|uniref:Uncharacterized protein n=1 Tax=Bacillus methanolicus PB1 TaxID=997296 RepID=I3DY20_BACMT|nr:hypothetical protein PB1_16329 [Bacillus methanolicus PB1]
MKLSKLSLYNKEHYSHLAKSHLYSLGKIDLVKIKDYTIAENAKHYFTIFFNAQFEDNLNDEGEPWTGMRFRRFAVDKYSAIKREEQRNEKI